MSEYLNVSVAFLSLLSLAVAIIISGYSRINLGIICIGFAFIVGHFFAGLKMEEIYLKGFPLGLFFLLLGTTLFSSIAKQNGTYGVLAKQLTFLSHGSRRLCCLIIFIFSFVFSFLGMGTIVTPVIMMPLLLETARKESIPEILAISLAISGSIAGGLSPFAPTGIIGNTLGAEVGVINYWPVYIAALITFTLHGAIVFFLFGGYKLSRLEPRPFRPMVLTGRQFSTIIVAFGVITAIFCFDQDIGLSTFFGATLLLICKAADQEKAIRGVSWNVMLLLCGISMLIYVVKASGGVDTVEAFVISEMTARNSGAFTALLAGAMSFVSSSSVVVMPTMIPFVPEAVAMVNGGVSPTFLLAAIIIGTHTVPYSPASTMGSIGLALSTGEDRFQIFLKLILTAFIMYFSTVFLFLAGTYGILNKF